MSKVMDLYNAIDSLPEKYKSVLPVEKVAKLYVAEENFRRQHIRNMRAKKTENQ